MKTPPSFLLLFSLVITGPLAAQTTPFTRIADTSTPIPGASGNFVAFSNMVSVNEDGDVAFSEDNFDAPSNDGIHFWSAGDLSLIADFDTAIPGGTGNFTAFSFFGNGIEGNTIAFRGGGASDQTGIYAYNGTILEKIADTTTAIPDGTGNFTGFTTAYVDGGDFAFIADGSAAQQGIYLASGATITRVADQSTPVPGIGGNFQWSSQLGFDGGNLSFWANVTGGTTPGNIIGAYSPGGGLTTLVTTATIVPGVGTPFTSLSSPADLSGTTVVFGGQFAGGSGLYTIDLAGGAITPVATTATSVPFGSGRFTSFSPAAIDGEEIAFVGNFSGGAGVYVRQNGRLRQVITTDDTLEGKDVVALVISENALAGGYLAFRAIFTGGAQGIYRLTTSEIVDPPLLSKAKLKKTVKRLTAQLKKARQAGQTSKAKRLAKQLRQLKKELRAF